MQIICKLQIFISCSIYYFYFRLYFVAFRNELVSIVRFWVFAHEYRCPQRSGEGAGSPGAGVSGGCECWEVSSGSPQVQEVLFSTRLAGVEV